MSQILLTIAVILISNIFTLTVADNGHALPVETLTYDRSMDSYARSPAYNGLNKDDIVSIKDTALSSEPKTLENHRDKSIWIGRSCQIEEKKNSLEETMMSDQSTENENGDQNVKECPEIRPEVCTQDYRPVCAELESGDMKTYSNGCNACTDPAVIGYREGACE